MGCGICTVQCPEQAIEGTYNAAEVLAAASREKTKAA
jgi:ferredoxin